MALLLAIDQGTTSSRALVFNEAGEIISVAQKEFQQYFPQPGWVEHDPMDIWTSQLSVAVEAVAGARASTSQLAGIGITNQRETTIVWDRATSEPVYPAIVWQDRRTAAFCDQLKRDEVEAEVQRRTGLLLDPYFSGTKVRWILDNVSGAREKAEAGRLAFGTVDSWLIWNLTGGRVHATDPSNASRTLLYNIHKGDWDDELLRILGVPRALLPQVLPSSGIFGTTKPESLTHSVPIAGVAGDQQSALFGQACFQPGLTKNTYGTGCFLLMQTGGKPVASANKLLTTIAWQVDGRVDYALEGSVFIAGALVQWLRDGLQMIRSASEIEPLAASVPDNGGVCLVPAFAGLGAPHWDPYARGILTGITRGVTRGHIARAALEAIALQVADIVEAMQADSGIPLKELRVDGGASSNDLLMQIQSDLLGVPVERAASAEITALGAAWLAGLATGVFRGQQQLESTWRAGGRFEPKLPASRGREMRHQWARAVERSKAWIES